MCSGLGVSMSGGGGKHRKLILQCCGYTSCNTKTLKKKKRKKIKFRSPGGVKEKVAVAVFHCSLQLSFKIGLL